MSLFKGWRRWSARLLRVGCLVSGLAPGLVWAQDNAPDRMPPKNFTKDVSFHLPIKMSPTMRADTREICLYVKQGPADWVRVESAPPTATHFTPKVSRDGEYWFTLVTISKSGKSTPPDPTTSPPGLRVVVDTAAPVIDVQPTATPEGEFCIRCNVLDPNFDPASLTAISKTDKGDIPLENVPGMSGTFRVRSSEMPFTVRITASDLARNSTTKDVSIRDLVLATMKTAPAEKISHAAHKIAPAPSIGSAPGTPPGLVEIPPARTDTTTLIPVPSAAGLPPMTLPPTVSAAPLSSLPPSLPPTAPAPIPRGLTEIPPGAGVRAEGFTMPAGATMPTVSAAPRAISAGKFGVPRQILSTPQVSIDYRIDQVGPSGVGRVDVYLTADNSQTWKKVKEDMDRRTPVEVELPGEGLFGLKLVITNGNGFGGNMPVRGEEPTCWVEVDATSPHVVLQPIEPISQNGQLEIRWSASDANLNVEPINLYFRTRVDGPWQAIAKNLRNEGQYRWAFPRDMGGQFWIKTEVTDLAGNVSRAETPTPVVLDMTEPRASVLGITSISVRPTAPVGN